MEGHGYKKCSPYATDQSFSSFSIATVKKELESAALHSIDKSKAFLAECDASEVLPVSEVSYSRNFSSDASKGDHHLLLAMLKLCMKPLLLAVLKFYCANQLLWKLQYAPPSIKEVGQQPSIHKPFRMENIALSCS